MDSVKVSAEIRARSDALFAERGLRVCLKPWISPVQRVLAVSTFESSAGATSLWSVVGHRGNPCPIYKQNLPEGLSPMPQCKNIYFTRARFGSNPCSPARRAEAMLDAGLIEEVTHLRTLGIENPMPPTPLAIEKASLVCEEIWKKVICWRRL